MHHKLSKCLNNHLSFRILPFVFIIVSDKWPKTQTGLPSTAGTTASVAFIRHGKIYIGHCGDSGIALGYTDDNDKTWQAMPLTLDHKPESNVEKARIINSGGKVVSKYGVPRVVWNRPRLGMNNDCGMRTF